MTKTQGDISNFKIFTFEQNKKGYPSLPNDNWYIGLLLVTFATNNSHLKELKW